MNWFLSEKLDGLCAIWTGHELLSRNRNRFHAPGWWTAGLPQEPLEGELWCGYGTLAECQSIVRRHQPDDRWHRVSFNIFDRPRMLCQPFADVAATLSTVANLPGHVRVIPQHRVPSPAHIRRMYDDVLARGGEGVILRHAGAEYIVRKLKRTCTEQRFRHWWPELQEVIA